MNEHSTQIDEDGTQTIADGQMRTDYGQCGNCGGFCTSQDASCGDCGAIERR